MEEYGKVAEQEYKYVGKDMPRFIASNDAHAVKLLKIPNKDSYEVHVGSPFEHARIIDMTLVDASRLADLPSLLESELAEWKEKNQVNPFPEEIQIIQPNWARDIWAVFFR